MILRKIYNSLNKSQKEDFVAGIAVGIVGGIAVGIVGGIVGGIAVGIVGGIAVGIAGGIVGGIGAGIAVGIVGGIVGGIFNNQFNLPIPIWLFFLICLAIAEILFVISMKSEKKRKNVSLWYILFRKAEEFFEVLLIVVAILDIRWLLQNIDFREYYPKILQWFGYFGLIAVAITIIWIWLYLNKRLIEK